MDKEDRADIYSERRVIHKKGWNNAIWSYIDGRIDYHMKEVGQKEKDKY